MEAPKKLYTQEITRYNAECHHVDEEFDPIGGEIAYIRSDLVDKLIGYAVHKDGCDSFYHMGNEERCTCGLSDPIKEVRG